MARPQPTLLALLLLVLVLVLPVPSPGEEAWKQEFDQLCGRTDASMELGRDELVRLLERCDRLRPEIEKLEATPRKVYLKRLQMCRNLYAYLLEQKAVNR